MKEIIKIINNRVVVETYGIHTGIHALIENVGIDWKLRAHYLEEKYGLTKEESVLCSHYNYEEEIIGKTKEEIVERIRNIEEDKKRKKKHREMYVEQIFYSLVSVFNRSGGLFR